MIEFKDMSLSYGKSAPVLKNLNVKIESAWKVGIVGRTGEILPQFHKDLKEPFL